MMQRSPYALARMRAGMNQTQAAEKLGMRRPTLCEIEKGKIDPRLSTLKSMAEAYGVTLYELIGPEGQEAR